LREGDLLKIDTACKKDGWCADAAISVIIGQGSPAIRRLVEVAERTLELAIREMGRRQWWSEVAAQMERFVKEHGYSVVEKYVGHGIGRTMHEPPQVPNYTNWEVKRSDWRLEPGIVVAVEPMVNMGHKEVITLPDKWTIVTRDRLPSAHVEHTIAITEHGIEVLTRD
jgi:methionyl aminopeptidase